MASTLLALAILAHTQADTNEFMEAWQADIPRQGMTIEHAETFADWHERHFWHFHEKSRPPVRPPQLPPDRGMGSNVEQWRGLVTQYFPDPNRALCIMSYESGGNPNAQNPSSGAAGLFQHLPKYWAERSARAGWAGADIFDPTANIAVAGWLRSVGGWTHWSPWNRGLCRH